jgi:HK97 family phage prohead protease
MKRKEKLYFKNIEIRSEEKENDKYIIGIIPYNSRSVEMWGTTEIIAPTAFNKTLSDGAEVRALINHDDSKILGSSKSGTLLLESNDNGLMCTVKLPDTTYANDIYEVITRGDCKTLSFGFCPIKWQDNEKEKTRTLTECQLLEVSYGVAFPAYPETTSLTYMRGIEKHNINIDGLNETLEKEEFNDNDKLYIQNTINILNNLLTRQAVTEPSVDTPSKDTLNEEKNIEKIKQLQLEIEAEIQI